MGTVARRVINLGTPRTVRPIPLRNGDVSTDRSPIIQSGDRRDAEIASMRMRANELSADLAASAGALASANAENDRLCAELSARSAEIESLKMEIEYLKSELGRPASEKAQKSPKGKKGK